MITRTKLLASRSAQTNWSCVRVCGSVRFYVHFISLPCFVQYMRWASNLSKELRTLSNASDLRVGSSSKLITQPNA